MDLLYVIVKPMIELIVGKDYVDDMLLILEMCWWLGDPCM